MDPKMGTPPNSPARPPIMMNSTLATAVFDAPPLHQDLQRTFRNVSLVVLEKNDDVGGVWFENKYPGCAAETPSHNYTFSFEPKPDFKSVHATGEEVLSFFSDFSRKYGLRDFYKFGYQVLLARWMKEEYQGSLQWAGLIREKFFTTAVALRSMLLGISIVPRCRGLVRDGIGRSLCGVGLVLGGVEGV